MVSDGFREVIYLRQLTYMVDEEGVKPEPVFAQLEQGATEWPDEVAGVPWFDHEHAGMAEPDAKKTAFPRGPKTGPFLDDLSKIQNTE